MQKNRKPDNAESEDNLMPENISEDEAATERFINRLELQRKLLEKFIGPASCISGRKTGKGEVIPDRKSRK